MSHMEEACESIDASVFSSDMLFDDERREMLKNYIGRWSRAIEEHERTPLIGDDEPGHDDMWGDDDVWGGDDMMGASG